MFLKCLCKQCSQGCLENPRTYNTAESSTTPVNPDWFPQVLRYGTSPMHFPPRTMENFWDGSIRR